MRDLQDLMLVSDLSVYQSHGWVAHKNSIASATCVYNNSAATVRGATELYFILLERELESY